jgi:hypothetical protein
VWFFIFIFLCVCACSVFKTLFTAKVNLNKTTHDRTSSHLKPGACSASEGVHEHVSDGRVANAEVAHGQAQEGCELSPPHEAVEAVVLLWGGGGGGQDLVQVLHAKPFGGDVKSHVSLFSGWCVGVWVCLCVAGACWRESERLVPDLSMN